MPADTLQKDLLRRVKGAEVDSFKRAVAVLEHLGCTVETEKDGRRVVAAVLTVPGHEPLRVEARRKMSGRTVLYPRPEYRYFRGEGSEEEAQYGADCKRASAISMEIRILAARATGQEEKLRRELQGLPAETPRHKDPDVRTCACCFRDIKATAIDGQGRSVRPGRLKEFGPNGEQRNGHVFMVEHGYTLSGDSGWDYGRSRVGGCIGIGLLPLEESVEGVQLLLRAALSHAKGLPESIQKARATLAYVKGLQEEHPPCEENGWSRFGGPYPDMPAYATVKVDGKYLGYRKGYEKVDVGPEDKRWTARVEGILRDLERQLADLWSGHFGSIPWLRAVIREWKPQAAEVVPNCGPPLVTVLEGDFEGRPAEAT